MNSFNHYAYGAIGNWLYTKVAGIQTHENAPGFKNTIIKPEITDKLNFVQATFNSMYGEIKSRWERKNKTLKLSVTIPPNTKAKVFLPIENQSFEIHEIGSGDYEFYSKMN